jgi:hypothetical protein
MFEDEEALEGGEGASDAGGSRSRGAVVAHAQHQANPAPAQVFHPPAYRGVVASWPQDWRERWGRRANELEEAGLSWRDAEAQAFVETWSLVRQGQRTGAIAPAGADPERN